MGGFSPRFLDVLRSVAVTDSEGDCFSDNKSDKIQVIMNVFGTASRFVSSEIQT